MALEQRVDGDFVPLGGRRDAEPYGVELDPLLGDLGDERVGLQLALDVLAQFGEELDVEVGDDGVDPDRQVLVVALQLLERLVREHRVSPSCS